MAYSSVRREDIDPYQKPDWLEFESVADSNTLVRPKTGFTWDLASGLESVLATVRPTVTISNNASDTSNDIDFSAGVAWDKTNLRAMTLTAMTKQLDATWAAGTNAGGLFSGAKAVSTWYYCFVIRKTSDGSIDCGFDTSKTAANIPSGYSGYRRVGAVRTDGSGNIYLFQQYGTNFQLVPPVVLSAVTRATSPWTFAAICPPLMLAKIKFSITTVAVAGASYDIIRGWRVSDSSWVDIAVVHAGLGTTTARDHGMNHAELPVDASSQLQRQSTWNSGRAYTDSQGWIDLLED